MSQNVIREVASRIIEIKQGFPFRVGIDGVDATGKTFLADELAACLAENGHSVIRASVDDFSHPRQVRQQRGSYSPEGYYYDSFNYELLKKCLLEPLEPEGYRKCCLKGIDFKTDTELVADELMVTNAHTLIFEGVLLFRHELEHYWDLKIFVDIDFETSLKRALARDLYLFGDKKEILKRYQERYIPGRKMYIESEMPHAKVDIVVNNNDFKKPFIAIHSNAF